MAELKSPVVPGLEDREKIFHDGNSDHYPIPALTKSGSILMRLEFTDDERTAILFNHDLYVEILGEGIQPVRYFVEDKTQFHIRKFCKEEGYDRPRFERRDEGLESFARLACDREGWEEFVRQYNEKFIRPPLPEEEVENIIRRIK